MEARSEPREQSTKARHSISHSPRGRPKMNSKRSILWPSFPRKREPRACPWLEQGASDVRSPLDPRFRGGDDKYSDGSLHLRSDTKAQHAAERTANTP